MTKRSEAADERAIKNQLVKRKKILDKLYKYAARNNISIFRPDLERAMVRFQRQRRRRRGTEVESYTCFLGQTVITTMHENIDKGAFCRPITCSRCNNGFVNRHRQQGIDRLDGERFHRIQPCEAVMNKLLVVPFNIEHSPVILDIPANRDHMEEIVLVKTLQIGPRHATNPNRITPRLPVRSIHAIGIPNPDTPLAYVTIFWSIVDRTRQTLVLPVANQELTRTLNREAARQGEELFNGLLVSDIRVVDQRGNALDIRALYLCHHWVLLDTPPAVAHTYGEQENENYAGELILGETGPFNNPLDAAVPPPLVVQTGAPRELRLPQPPERAIREENEDPVNLPLDPEEWIEMENIRQDYEIAEDEPPEDVPL
jgi:hypothetical protein